RMISRSALRACSPVLRWSASTWSRSSSTSRTAVAGPTSARISCSSRSLYRSSSICELVWLLEMDWKKPERVFSSPTSSCCWRLKASKSPMGNLLCRQGVGRGSGDQVGADMLQVQPQQFGAAVLLHGHAVEDV